MVDLLIESLGNVASIAEACTTLEIRMRSIKEIQGQTEAARAKHQWEQAATLLVQLVRLGCRCCY